MLITIEAGAWKMKKGARAVRQYSGGWCPFLVWIKRKKRR